MLSAGELTLVESDRFRPELLRLARDAMAAPAPPRGIAASSSAGARRAGDGSWTRRRIAAALAEHGFEAVEMERLDLDAQIALMAEAEAVVAPHGAGLANMLFCRAGAKVLEIADPAYPNPNFYAMAAGLGLDYGLLAARGVGAGHPLDRDLAVDARALRAAVEEMLR